MFIIIYTYTHNIYTYGFCGRDIHIKFRLRPPNNRGGPEPVPITFSISWLRSVSNVVPQRQYRLEMMSFENC